MAAAFVDLQKAKRENLKDKDLEKENERLKRKYFYDLKQFNSEREKWLDQFTQHMDDSQSKVFKLKKMRDDFEKRTSVDVADVIDLLNTQIADYMEQRSTFIQSQREINRSTRTTPGIAPKTSNESKTARECGKPLFKRPRLGAIENNMTQNG